MCRVAVVANEDHVTAGIQRKAGAVGHRTEIARRLHAQVVAENGAAKAESRTQLALNPVLGKSRGPRIDLLIYDVRQHYAGNHAGIDETLVGPHVVENQAVIATIDGQLHM